MHPLDEFLDVALHDTVELESLACGKTQGRGGDIVSEFVEDKPLFGRGLAAGEADAAHEGEGLFLPFLLECVAHVSVILHVETMELGELVAFLGDVARGGVSQVGGDVAAQMVRVDLVGLVGGEGFGGWIG